jgi:hypothetical protein
MSLAPHWYSTIFGVYFFAGSAVGVYAVLTIFAVLARRARAAAGAITLEHLHDLGKLLFAFVSFWAYIAFSQYLLIWYANLPEETVWYAHRLSGGWTRASTTLALGHFVLPFFFLLPRTIKRHPGALLAAASWMLVMHYGDLYWQIMPPLHPEGPRFTAIDAATLLGIGGLLLASLAWMMRRSAIVPLRDPRLAESLALENT